MSSYLGKTGTNLRTVLDYAKSRESVLLLDEFDAIAKRRDDEGEIGELKRLVTVLLQEIDDWPDTSVLIAATNHGDLLDPAAWRRFDAVLEFDVPSDEVRRALIERTFGEDAALVSSEGWPQMLAQLWNGRSHSNIVRSIQAMRRQSIVQNVHINECILSTLDSGPSDLALPERRKLARRFREMGFSDHRISDITGMSRDTLRKMWNSPARPPTD
jgi:SpoVK/Ycf46/Vps4 family AAA+-type ATPase